MRNKSFVLRKGFLPAAMAAALIISVPVQAAPDFGWDVVDGNYYWYENGIKQGTEGRGKEIYDPASDAWYWLDSVDNGRRAVSKDVYQESGAGPWAEQEDGTGKWVRYDENGHMVKGWDVDENGVYYFDPQYGTMAKGNVEIDGVPCSFDKESGIGADLVWIEIDGNEYWYEGGVRQGLEGRGREVYDPGTNAWYWLDSVDKGRKAVSKDVYQESAAGDWAENEDGTGKWVRYDGEGHMVKGWDTNEKGTYFFDYTYGTMAKGVVAIEGKSYSFDESTGVYQGAVNESYGVGTEYHTQEEIRNYMAESGASFNHGTEMETEPNLSAPYAVGSVKRTSLEDALAMLNQIRYIAGLNYDVALNDEYIHLAQSGSFLNAVNRQMSHTPARPEGMSDEMYQDGYKGASSSNIAYASWKISLSSCIKLWMDDSDASNISRIGHRRWILNPPMKETGFGYAVGGNGAAYASVYAFGNWSDKTPVRGTAWPAREMPVEYFADHSAWSYSYGESLSNITVRLACQNAGSSQVWNFSAESSDGYFNVENGNYGQKGCVIFRPDGIKINAGDQYLVTIYQGEEVLANYTVNFF